MRKTALIFLSLGFLSVVISSFFYAPGAIYAQEVASSDTVESSDLMDDGRRRPREIQNRIRDTRSERRSSLRTRRDKLEERRDKLTEKREELRKRREELRKKREEARERMREKREEFKKRMRELKDQRKKRIVEKVDAKLIKINERWVNHWDRVLGRLAELLTKIDSRADKAEDKGRDASAVRLAIAAAEEAIDTARGAVEAQAGKEYVIAITDEESLKDDVHQVTGQLRTDLSGVKESVFEAKRAVREALTALKNVKPDQEGGE